MPAITPSTFDPLLAYVNVRLQQGVPIVDADLNELDDIRKFELRAFLKWYVGDGVPEGNNGFQIQATGLANDFTIAAGVPSPPVGTLPVDVGLRHVGRAVVDGLDVIIDRDTLFSTQALPEERLTTPTDNHQLVVYLDVWERLVTQAEKPQLMLPGLGIETCARMRREWRVRVARTLPVPPAGHAFLTLASITRTAGVGTVAATDVRDLRQRRLLMPPAHLITDMLGPTVNPLAYRRGEGRPVVSLREAINALLAGTLPSTPDIAVSVDSTGDDVTRQTFLTDSTGVTAVWQSPRNAGTIQVYAAKLGTGLDVFPAPRQLTTGTPHTDPTAVLLPSGEIVVVYQSAGDVLMKRGTLDGLPTAAEQPAAATPNADIAPYAVLAGEYVVIFVQSGSQWWYRRYRHTTGVFEDANPVNFVATSSTEFHAMTVPGGSAWVAFKAGSQLQVERITPRSSPSDLVRDTRRFISPSVGSLRRFSILATETSALMFFADGAGLRMATSTDSSEFGTAIPDTDQNDDHPYAVREPNGTIWLFHTRTVGGNTDIYVRRRTGSTNEWTASTKLISSPAADQAPYPVFVPDQGVWILFQSNRAGGSTMDLYARRLINAI